MNTFNLFFKKIYFFLTMLLFTTILTSFSFYEISFANINREKILKDPLEKLIIKLTNKEISTNELNLKSTSSIKENYPKQIKQTKQIKKNYPKHIYSNEVIHKQLQSRILLSLTRSNNKYPHSPTFSFKQNFNTKNIQKYSQLNTSNLVNNSVISSELLVTNKIPLHNKEDIAKSISNIYKHISLHEATKVVEQVYKQSNKYGFNSTFFLGLIAVESSYKKYAKSVLGASGYTQVLTKFHNDKIKNRNIFDTTVNIEVGSKIFSDCLKRHNILYKSLGCYLGTKDYNKIFKYYSNILINQMQILELSKG